MTLSRAIPGMAWIRQYRAPWLRADLVAGITVAAVILPIGMAYGQLAGLPPAAGIYASMLPLVMYALFGSSRLLIIGPDASSAALVAAAVAPLAGGNATQYADLAAFLAVLTGLLCVVGGLARMGFIASFLSKPILVGYMNGLALTVIVSQLPSVLGISVRASGFFAQIGQLIAMLSHANAVTLCVGVGVFVIVWMLRRIAPQVPGPLVAVVGATVTAAVWHLDVRGVAAIGTITPGLPALSVPHVTIGDTTRLLGDALGIALLTFSDTILTARSFAARSGDHVHANQELIGLGVANGLAGLSQGFPVSASGARTAVNEAAGGKTQLASVIAAVILAVMLLFLTGPLSKLPTAALGAVLIAAAARLFDMRTLRALGRADRRELAIALATLVGVLAVGLLQGIVLAIALSLVLLLARAVRPHDAILGRVKGVDGFHDIEEYPQGSTIPGLIVYRFDAPLFFANADFFQRRVRRLVAESPGPVEWFLLDAEALTAVDSTAAEMLEETRRELAGQGIVLVVARAKHPLREHLGRFGLLDTIGPQRFYPSIRSAVAAFIARNQA
jgi:high affinity sulfate transporter 1